MTPQALAAVVSPLASSPGSMDRWCGSSAPSIACRLVWDISRNGTAAQTTQVYAAGPLSAGLRIAGVLLLALLLRAGARRLISRFARRISENADLRAERNGYAAPERRRQRAAALASILRNVASITIFSIALMMILGDMGLNLAPILASAGVIGIAIGFGAQNLVQDFLAGIFMLLEDQYGIGDSVSIGSISGTVEGVSLRITRVRDVNGVAWHIRNGTIQQAGNQSHGWARAVVDFPVPYDSDVPAISAGMAEAATDMWRESPWRGIILDQPEVWGVQDVSVETVVLRVTARTAPMRQFEVARELRRRLISAVEIVAAEQAAGQITAGAGEAAAQARPLTARPRRPGSAAVAAADVAAPQAAATKTAGPQTRDPETAGPETAGAKTAGAETAGPAKKGRRPGRLRAPRGKDTDSSGGEPAG
ncbi:MAG: mechanosensitive ion channel family protein [Streptosporangiaceae bacterium]